MHSEMTQQKGTLQIALNAVEEYMKEQNAKPILTADDEDNLEVLNYHARPIVSDLKELIAGLDEAFQHKSDLRSVLAASGALEAAKVMSLDIVKRADKLTEGLVSDRISQDHDDRSLWEEEVSVYGYPDEE